MSTQASAAKSKVQVETVTIRFVGDSGDGMQLTGIEFTKANAIAGNDIATFPDYPAEIRAPAGSLAGVSGYQVNFSSKDILTPGDAPDVLVAMNPAALKQSVKIFLVDMNKLTETALAGSGLSNKEAARCKNYFALGLMYWLYSRDIEPQVASIAKKFAKKPEIAQANQKVFRAGHAFAETSEVFFQRYEVPASNLPPGPYRNVTGNYATALGFAAVAKTTGRQVFLGSYPITPATE